MTATPYPQAFALTDVPNDPAPELSDQLQTLAASVASASGEDVVWAFASETGSTITSTLLPAFVSANTTAASLLGGSLLLPQSWATFNADLFVSSDATGSPGNSFYEWRRAFVGAGDTRLGSGSIGPIVWSGAVATSGTTEYAFVALETGIALVPGDLFAFDIRRWGGDAADTHPVNIQLYAVRFTKAS